MPFKCGFCKKSEGTSCETSVLRVSLVMAQQCENAITYEGAVELLLTNRFVEAEATFKKVTMPKPIPPRQHTQTGLWSEGVCSEVP